MSKTRKTARTHSPEVSPISDVPATYRNLNLSHSEDHPFLIDLARQLKAVPNPLNHFKEFDLGPKFDGPQLVPNTASPESYVEQSATEPTFGQERLAPPSKIALPTATKRLVEKRCGQSWETISEAVCEQRYIWASAVMYAALAQNLVTAFYPSSIKLHKCTWTSIDPSYWHSECGQIAVRDGFRHDLNPAHNNGCARGGPIFVDTREVEHLIGLVLELPNLSPGSTWQSSNNDPRGIVTRSNAEQIRTTRRKSGRKAKYNKSEIFTWLGEEYHRRLETNEDISVSDLARFVLEKFSWEKGDEPAESTARRYVRKFLDQKQNDAAHKGS